MNLSDLNEVLKHQPTDIFAAIGSQSLGECFVENSLGWEGFASVAGTRASRHFHAHRLKEGLAWARIGVFVYEGLAKQASQLLVPRHLLSAMTLRAAAIAYCGATDQDSLLDPTIVETWFFRSVQSGHWILRHELGDLANLSPDELGEVYKIRDHLQIMESGLKLHLFVKEQELLKLKELTSHLP
jgi:hypothetical protein